MTVKDITQLALYERVGRVEAKVDELLARSQTNSRRVRKLEAWQSRATGIVIAISAVAGGVGSYCASIVKKAGLI